jgi:hypothetical protein
MKGFGKFFSVTKKFFGHMGFCFMTIIVLLLTTLVIAFPGGGKVMDTGTYVYLLLFSALHALCVFIFDIKFIESYLAKLSIHYICVVIDFAVTVAWGTGLATGAKQMLFITIVFAFVYLIIEAVRAAFHFATNKKSNEEEEYTSLFSGKN